MASYREKAEACRTAASLAGDPVVKQAFTEACHFHTNMSEGPIILMRERRYYPSMVMADAAVVIDKNGWVVKNRNGMSGILAGDELLAAAFPAFPPDEDRTDPAEQRGREFHDTAAGLAPPEEGFVTSDKYEWNIRAIAWVAMVALLSSIVGLGLAIGAYVR